MAGASDSEGPMPEKKRVLLIHPLGVNWIPGQKDMSRIANIMPPIGLCSLAAWLEQRGHTVHIHDCYAFPGRDERIEEYLRTERPDIVGFSTTTSSFLDAARLARGIKDAYPRITTVIGGVHVSALREGLLRDYPQFDLGVVGEGEEAMEAICERDARHLDDVPGVIHRADGAPEFNGLVQPSLELDRLPFPAYEKLPGYPAAYRLPIFNYPRGPGTTAITSRGCPYQCSYCDRSVFRRSFRFHSPEYMVELFRHLRLRFGIRHVNLYDDNFTVNSARVAEFCDRMAASSLGMTFNCAARAERLTPEMLAGLRRAGCWMISLGIESGDIELLARHRSKADLDMIRERVRWIRKAGIRAKGLFMLGLPGETERTIDNSIDYALSLPLNELNVAKFTPFPGSPLYAGIREQGTFDENWELMNCLNFVFVPNGLTRERLEERYHEFYRRHFQRWRVLFGYVTMLWKSPGSWWRFVRNLGDFLAVRKSFEKAEK